MLKTRHARDEDGAIAVIAGALSATLFLVAALVVQFGFTRDVRQDSQNAADAAALAAAFNVTFAGTVDLGLAVDVATSYGAKNAGLSTSAWDGCTDPNKLDYVVAGKTPCVSFDSGAKPTRVRVVVPARETKTGVGGGAGVQSITVGAVAEAAITVGAEMKCALCFLGPIDSGNADYTVVASSIAVSGSISLGPNGHMTSTGGQVAASGTTSGGTYSPSPVVKIAPFTDPWAGRADLPPATTSLDAKTNPCSTGNAGGQGIYGSFAIPTSCHLQPGLYVITGTWSEGNKSLLSGDGVTLYFTCKKSDGAPRVCNDGEVGGSLNAKNGEVAIKARTSLTIPVTRAVNDVAIMYDRGNAADVGLQGNGETSITGAVYAPHSKLDFNGNSCFGFSKGPVIAQGVVKANGNKSCVKVANAIEATYANLPSSVNLSK